MRSANLVPIGDCVKKIETWDPKKSRSSREFKYIDLSSIDKEKKIIDGNLVSSITSEEAPSRARQLVKTGDILIATVRPNLNGVAEVTETYEGATASTGYCVLRPNALRIDGKYLFHWLRTNSFVAEMLKLATGANYPAVSDKIVKNSLIPLPPLEEQKRIAAILDKADAIRRKRQQAIELADQLLRSVFLDMFGNPATNPKGFPTKTIEEFVADGKYSLKRGPFGGALKKEIFIEEGYLVYEQYHALNNDFSYQRYFIDENKFEELKAFEVKAGDIIISCSGVNLGRLASVPQGVPKGIINQALLKLTLDNNIMLNEMFIQIFSHPNFKASFYGDFRGAAIPNFPPMSTFKEFKFIVPPIELQKKYLKKVTIIESEKASLQKSASIIGDMIGSISSRAFSGKLTQNKAA